jgi:hypothetical protein
VSGPVLHLPDEPSVHKEKWLAAVNGGAAVSDVIPELADWLWGRWRSIGAAGMDRSVFEAVVLAYRREIWLWLAGERTWDQCCSGLIGRVGRRLPVPG